jgi:EAL and modified HD-GYP domain-containing signal transduction protein
MSSAYLCRQPIFDRGKAVYGYKLAHRAPINGSLSVDGLADLASSKPAFIHITRKLLVEANYLALPRTGTVIELREALEADAEVLAACKTLKDAGYTLALDDFACDDIYRPLLELADILKIDFLSSDADRRKWFRDTFGGKNVMLLAEKVETHEDFDQAFDLGYTYFQGYFFCKPEVCEFTDVPAYKQNYLRFIQEVNAPQLDFDRLETVVKTDMSLSAKLLRFLNSSAMGISNRITSIKQALTMLGEKPLRKWATLVALLAMGDDKPTELIVTALVRARVCELVGAHAGLRDQDLELFMMGLFSTLDALLDQPMGELLSRVPLSPDVAAALLGANSAMGRVYALALAIERGRGPRVDQVASQLRVDAGVVTDSYRQAVVWADQNIAA